jgi:hypothetical protein
MNRYCFFALAVAVVLPIVGSAEEPVFPFYMPKEKPDMPLSAAMERVYDNYDAPTY